MARNNPKPSEKINWQAIGEIIVPSAARKLAGWLFNIKPPAQNFNWKWNLDSLQQLYTNAQVQDWIVIDSDADEGDYATLTAYLADAPAAGNRVLIKEDQTVTVQTVIPSDITLKFLDGSRLLCATNIATSVLQFGSNVIVEGVLNIILSQTGVTAKAVELNGDNVTGKINVENSSTGTLTTAYHINASKTGNKIDGFAQNTGGGILTNIVIDNSNENSNLLEIVNGIDNVIERSNGDQRQSVILIDPELVGSGLAIGTVGTPGLTALNRTDVAFVDNSNNELRAYGFDGSIWALLGSGLSIGNITDVAALDGTDVALYDSTSGELRTYRFNGAIWALVGNGLAIATVGGHAITALNSTDIAFYDVTNDELRAYNFDGTDWTLIGSGFSIASTGTATITALNSTDIAFYDNDNQDLRTYRFNGSVWALVGNELNLGFAGNPAITALSETDIAYIDAADQELKVYRFDKLNWSLTNIGFTLSGSVGVPTLAAMNGTDVAFIDSSGDELRKYRFRAAIGLPHSPDRFL